MNSGTSGMGRVKIDWMDGWFQATYYGQDNNDYGSDSTDTATVSNTNANDGMIEPLSYLAATSLKDMMHCKIYNHTMKSCNIIVKIMYCTAMER